jgi:SAM-dependent methyltransferase
MNEFVIPRAVARCPLARPWRIVDLGCGSGGSSAILARQAPPGSSLIGYDLSASLLETARRRVLVDRAGGPVRAEFVCQPITEPLRTAGGELLPARSVDIAHAAGIVGHDLREGDVEALARELRRVLAAGGLAILDSGPRLGPRALARTMRGAGFDRLATHRLLPFTTRTASVFRLR